MGASAPISNPLGGQLEDNDNLPALPKKENLHYLYNPGTQKYDVIDLSTGKQVATEQFETSAVIYTLALADYICDLVRNGKTIKAVGDMNDLPSATRIYAWEAIYPEFKARLKLAKQQRGEHFADKALEVAMSVTHKDAVPAAKLQVDTLRWRAEKADPDNYGSKREDSGPKGTSISITLHTGVLDSPAPRDIVVDEFGNFKGFDGDEVEETRFEDHEVVVELSKDRFTEIEDGEE